MLILEIEIPKFAPSGLQCMQHRSTSHLVSKCALLWSPLFLFENKTKLQMVLKAGILCNADMYALLDKKPLKAKQEKSTEYENQNSLSIYEMTF